MRTSRALSFVLGGFVAIGALLSTIAAAHAQTASQLYSEGVDALKAGDVAGAKKKLQLTLEVDKNFRPASALLTKIAQDEKQGATQPPGLSARTLEKIVVPVEFKDATLQSALEFLRQRIEADSGGKTKVNFVLNLPPGMENKKITLQMSHVPVTEVLRYIGDLAGVVFQVQKFAIVVTPAGGPASASSPGGTPAATP